MKKTIGFVLALALCVGLFAVLGVSTYASDNEYHVNRTGCYPVDVCENESAYIYFSPEESSDYTFWSETEFCDPQAELYDMQGDLIAESNDEGGGENFRFTASLSDEETYCLEIWTSDDGDYTFNVFISDGDDGYFETISGGASTYLVTASKDTHVQIDFTPEESGSYTFRSDLDECDPEAVLYDESGEEIDLYDEEPGDFIHFTASLTADETYRLDISTDEHFLSTFHVYISKDNDPPPAITGEPEPETYSVTANRTNKVYINFTPSVDGIYTFWSEAENCDPVAVLWLENGTCVARNDDDGEGSNFRFTVSLSADVTYVLLIYTFDDDLCTFDVNISYNSGQASTLSQGNVWIVAGIAVVAAGAVTALVITKKKKPAAANTEEE